MKISTKIETNENNCVYKVNSNDGHGYFMIVAKSINDVMDYLRETYEVKVDRFSIEYLGDAITIDKVEKRLVAEGEFVDGNPSIPVDSPIGDIRFLQAIESIPVDEEKIDE